MLKTFMAKNFRCFPSIEITNLARVNLIAGKNNAGKTAILEAICLHCDASDSQLPTTIHAGRGMRALQDLENRYGDLWAWLLPGRDKTLKAELSSEDTEGMARTVNIQLTDVGSARSGTIDVPKAPPTFPGQGWYAHSPCLILSYNSPDKEPRVVWVIGPHGEAWYTPAEAWHMPCVFVAAQLSSNKRDIAHFSQLENEKHVDDLLPSLIILEPRLKKLALTKLGDDILIHGDIGLDRLVPIPLMGEGMRRLLSILLAVFNSPGGIVLIDEIENGLHYSVVKDVWKAIGQAARQANVQVFATTHSWECIQAAHSAFRESTPYELRYYRLERIGKKIGLKAFDENMLERVQHTDLEIR